MQGSCSPDNNTSSPSDEAVDAFFAGTLADLTGGIQKGTKEEGAQAGLGAAQDEGMGIGHVTVGGKGEGSEMDAGVDSVRSEGLAGNNDEAKANGRGGTEGASGSVQSAEPSSRDGTATEARSLLAVAPLDDFVPRNAQVKNTPPWSRRRRRDRSRSWSPMGTLSRRLTFTLRFREPRDQLTVSPGRWVQVGEVLQLRRLQNVVVIDAQHRILKDIVVSMSVRVTKQGQ